MSSCMLAAGGLHLHSTTRLHASTLVVAIPQPEKGNVEILWSLNEKGKVNIGQVVAIGCRGIAHQLNFGYKTCWLGNLQ